MGPESKRPKLGRLDTCRYAFGPFQFWARPDRSSDRPAVLLLSITGPGLPSLCITEDGVRTLSDDERDELGMEPGRGTILFGSGPGPPPRLECSTSGPFMGFGVRFVDCRPKRLAVLAKVRPFVNLPPDRVKGSVDSGEPVLLVRDVSYAAAYHLAGDLERLGAQVEIYVSTPAPLPDSPCHPA